MQQSQIKGQPMDQFIFPKTTPTLILCVPVPSNENLCKQFRTFANSLEPYQVGNSDDFPERIIQKIRLTNTRAK